jgi:signal transduction histidine kinase
MLTMKIRTKVVLLFTLGALPPLVVSHVLTVRTAMRSMESLVSKDLSDTAAMAASHLRDHVAETSLADICSVLEHAQGGGIRRAMLLDRTGRPVCVGGRQRDRLDVWRSFTSVRTAAPGEIVRYRDEWRRPVIAVTEDIPAKGWKLIVEQPEALAMAPLYQAAALTSLWVTLSLIVLLVGGALLARGITGPLVELETAAARMDERTRELKEAQGQILETQKLAALGELGSGAAHEINNPLATVIGNAQLLLADADPSSETAASLRDIVASARRVAAVADDLLRYSQTPIRDDMQVLDPAAVLDACAGLFEARLAERGITVERSYAPDCLVNGQEADLRLAFSHVIENAVTAMGGGGRLALRVDRVEGGAVRIGVADLGTGMSDDVRARAFDPFFTTHAPGSGSRGLGLALVQRVVSDHRGRIVLDSALGQGTTLTIYLPGATKPSRA